MHARACRYVSVWWWVRVHACVFARSPYEITQRRSQENGDQHSAAQHRTAQHRTAQHSIAQHSAAHHRPAQNSTLQHSTAQHSIAQHSTYHHNTPQFNISSRTFSCLFGLTYAFFNLNEPARFAPYLTRKFDCHVLLFGSKSSLARKGTKLAWRGRHGCSSNW